jgi:fucose permease
MVGFGVIVSYVQAEAGLILVFACSLVLGLGANAIVSAGHALVADIAETQRNAALNLLDVCFGLGLAILPQIAKRLPRDAGLGMIFWVLAVFTAALLVLVVVPRFPRPTHPESFPTSEVRELFQSPSFWLLAIALFMYVGTEVAVGKWVVTFIERDPQLLAAVGIDADSLQRMAQSSPDALTNFFKSNQSGIDLSSYALSTLSLFGLALVIGRLISSFVLGVMKVRSLLLLVAGSTLTAVGLAIALTASTPSTVRWAILASGIGMGPIFPTSVGLASVIVPRISGTAMSWVMGIGFAGLLVIPPSVGYISEAAGGQTGDVRKGLLAVLTAAIIMLALHIVLAMRERRRTALGERVLEPEVAAGIE